MLTFLHATTAGEPVWICEDVRRHIHAMSRKQYCQRCRVVVADGGGDGRVQRVRLCFTPAGTLCFECWHRVRWPAPQ